MLAVHSHCDRGMAGLVYPDGGAMLDQPLLMLDAFTVIASAMNNARKARNAQD